MPAEFGCMEHEARWSYASGVAMIHWIKEKYFMSKTSMMAVLTVGLGCLALGGALAGAAEKPKERFFEMRTYIAAEGKLDALNARFRDHTNKLFVKHGMELIGYWTPTEGPAAQNTLVYILAYPDKESRDNSWKGFVNDPDWKKAHAESEKNGKLVDKVISQYLKPTDYSPIK
jgi:NIPSNAP